MHIQSPNPASLSSANGSARRGQQIHTLKPPPPPTSGLVSSARWWPGRRPPHARPLHLQRLGQHPLRQHPELTHLPSLGGQVTRPQGESRVRKL
jgi:hypothetical protein